MEEFDFDREMVILDAVNDMPVEDIKDKVAEQKRLDAEVIDKEIKRVERPRRIRDNMNKTICWAGFLVTGISELYMFSNEYNEGTVQATSVAGDVATVSLIAAAWSGLNLLNTYFQRRNNGR